MVFRATGAIVVVAVRSTSLYKLPELPILAPILIDGAVTDKVLPVVGADGAVNVEPTIV